MYPPNAHLYDANELQGTYVHRALVKELSEITKTLFGTDLLVADEAAKSVTLELHSTFEKKGARRLAVSFDKAVATITYDDFSRGNENTRKQTTTVDVSEISDMELAVSAVVSAMAKTEPVFGAHVRFQSAETARRIEEQNQKRANFSGRWIT